MLPEERDAATVRDMAQPCRMAGMRDVLIHAYDRVDLDEFWRTVTSDVPPLLELLARLLPDETP